MRIKATELTENRLNWAVAKCLLGENLKYVYVSKDSLFYHDPGDNKYYLNYLDGTKTSAIIEIEKIATWWSKGRWNAQYPDTGFHCYGPTHTIAALRCFVSQKLGYEVELPEELR